MECGEAAGGDLLAVARDAIRHANQHDLRLAGILAAIERKRTYAAEAASSAAHWATLNGLDSMRAHELLRLGRLVDLLADVDALVREATLTPQAAAIVGGLVPPTPLLDPLVDRDPADVAREQQELAERARLFVQCARHTSRRQLIRDVCQEKERIKQGERVVPLRFFVKQRVRDEWRIAAKIARRKSGAALSEGEVFEAVTGDYLTRHDNDGLSGRKKTGKRRDGPTGGGVGSRVVNGAARNVPADVKRTVMARAHGHCEFAGCQNGTYLQICHLLAFAAGGACEPHNLVVLCTQHHTMMDKGLIRFLARTAGGVSFVVTRTAEIVEPDPRVDAADVLPDRGALESASCDAATATATTSERGGYATPEDGVPPVASPGTTMGPPGNTQKPRSRGYGNTDSGVAEDAPAWQGRGPPGTAATKGRRRPVSGEPAYRWRRHAPPAQSRRIHACRTRRRRDHCRGRERTPPGRERVDSDAGMSRT